MNTITAGLFSDSSEAEATINEIRAMGIEDKHISYLQKDVTGTVVAHTAEDALTEEGKDLAKDTGKGAASGAITGGALGGLAGLAAGAGIIPGLGVIIASGPIAAALGVTGMVATAVTGVTGGALAGGVIGALTGLSVSEPDAHLYAEQVSRGETLIVVQSDVPGLAKVMERHHGKEIREYSQSS